MRVIRIRKRRLRRAEPEHINFASDLISAGLIGKDQAFTVKPGGDTFTKTGVLSNGKDLSDAWKRVHESLAPLHSVPLVDPRTALRVQNADVNGLAPGRVF